MHKLSNREEASLLAVSCLTMFNECLQGTHTPQSLTHETKIRRPVSVKSHQWRNNFISNNLHLYYETQREASCPLQAMAW